ncbi:Sgd1p [Cryptosporidium canis]|uniref:Sgd1p n=1 Tax=Cryptosporidium canis TaxID=195482 RepID=A0ABQ8PES8_9CRYT|nr:Sgd1p [Cryptosporidium canis]KAJ1615494.1 Sgd1p [Cryptosporidium canis]
MKKEYDEEDITILEKKLGIIKGSRASEPNSEKKRKALYKKIEKEDGIGDDFLDLLDGIISISSTKKRKANDKPTPKIKKERKIDHSIIQNIQVPSLKIADKPILNWQNKFRQNVQGLLNRLSEGNMTIILEKLFELVKSTTNNAYNNNRFEYESLLKQRNESIQATIGYFVDDNCTIDRLIVITDIIESDLIFLFIKSCIIQPQNTVSLITVYSALVSSLGILLESNFILRLTIALNFIYNKTLSDILQNIGPKADIYNSKLILRHIAVSLVAIYRCGFISSTVLESFIKTGMNCYDLSKSNINYWECFFDNLLTIIRGSALYLRDDSIYMYETIIEEIESKTPTKVNLEHECPNIADHNYPDNYIHTKRLKFIIDEVSEWKHCLRGRSLNQRLKRREGILERQLNTVHCWSLNCVLLKYLQIIYKDKKTVINSGKLDLVSYPKTLIEYKWQDSNKNLYSMYLNKFQEDVMSKLINFYNIGKKQSDQSQIKKAEDKVTKNIITDNNLLNLASKMRFTSDIQKSVFVALIGAIDECDAISRLTSLNIIQSKAHLSSVINVIVISSLSEHTYNPYYYKVIQGLTELPAVISKKVNKEINICFSQKLGIIDTLSIRKVLILCQLVKDCIIGGIFDLNIIRFINIGDINALAGQTGLFLKELIMSILIYKKKTDGRLAIEIFSSITKMQDLKEVILFVIQSFIIPAIEKKSIESNNSNEISKIELLELCKLL